MTSFNAKRYTEALAIDTECYFIKIIKDIPPYFGYLEEQTDGQYKQHYQERWKLCYMNSEQTGANGNPETTLKKGKNITE